MKKIDILMVLLLVMMMSAVQVQAINPTLKLSVSNYNPLPAAPGRNVDVWINVQNVGTEEANNIELEIVDSTVFKLLSNNDRVKIIPVLGTQNDKIIKYTLKVSDSAPDGSNEILFKYTIGNIVGSTFESKTFIDVKSTEAPITISKVIMEPETITPGSSSELSLLIKNLAKSTSLKDVTISLGLAPVVSATAILIDYPFVPVGSANQKTINRILPGQTAEIKFQLAAYPDATAQIYKLPIFLSYYDDTGTNYNKSVLIGIEVNSIPDILVVVESSEINSKVKEGTVSFEITNRGLSDIKLMTITLEESDDYEILSPSSEVYIGNIDSDDFENVRFEVKINGDAKEIAFPLQIEYKDALNKRFSEDIQLKYVVREAHNGNSGATTIVILVVIVVIVGMIIFFKKRKKKRRQG